MDSGKRNMRNMVIGAVKAIRVINCDQKIRRVWKSRNEKTRQERL